MINSSLFFLRQCESLDWSDCLVVLLLSATHFRKSGHARLIRGCYSFSQCFRAGVFLFHLPAPSPLLLTRPISSSLREVSTWRFREQIACTRKTPALQARVPFVSAVETEILNLSKTKPLEFKRFIDDIFSLWITERKEIAEFITLPKRHHSTIKFTAEISDKEINFLDTTVYKRERFHNQGILDIRGRSP